MPSTIIIAKHTAGCKHHKARFGFEGKKERRQGAIAKDYLTPDKLAEVEKLDNLMAALLDTDLDYHAIKGMLL